MTQWRKLISKYHGAFESVVLQITLEKYPVMWYKTNAQMYRRGYPALAGEQCWHGSSTQAGKNDIFTTILVLTCSSELHSVNRLMKTWRGDQAERISK